MTIAQGRRHAVGRTHVTDLPSAARRLEHLLVLADFDRCLRTSSSRGGKWLTATMLGHFSPVCCSAQHRVRKLVPSKCERTPSKRLRKLGECREVGACEGCTHEAGYAKVRWPIVSYCVSVLFAHVESGRSPMRCCTCLFQESEGRTRSSKNM